MKNLLLRIYDYFAVHRRVLWIGFTVVFAALVALAATLRYNEDIMDFLPITTEERAALDAYQSQDAAAQLVLIIDGGEEDQRYEALDEIDALLSAQGYQLSLEMDPTEQIAELYAQLPCLIADSVYDCFDSLFTPEAVRTALLRDRTILNTPGSSFLAPAIQNDPLGLVQMPSFQTSLASSKNYAFLESPYGGTETQKNAALVDSLQAVTEAVAASFPELNIRWTGAPVIAVGNARRIKTDTLLCISLSAVLIILLLAYAFPRRRDIWLILLSVSVGWVTGMAVLHMVTPAVSAVVLGIGSVLIGIAVNYPLHLLVHQRYTASVRQTLDEVLSPLIVGNITTVGAFLTLVPMQATALRHLGLFASAMLVGTILFCIFVLPHLMSAEPTRIREIRLRVPRLPAPWLILALTVIAGLYLWLCPYDRFDSNLNHINYMTSQQREDMAAFDVRTDDAARWTEYWSSHDPQSLITTIRNEAAAAGFRPEAFQPFYDHLTSVGKDAATISIGGLMAKISERLSDNFDYIGACCSLIVFIFLWISFKRFSLALVAFVPMALSWIWILAIMQLCSLQFNIVNIILATFIFGQGDDYTIFIVEGILYERRTGKTILPQYRQSIILSALIMLVGIGILVFAVHPAMHSLGVVTLIGMAVVLLMAFTIPPFLSSLRISRSSLVILAFLIISCSCARKETTMSLREAQHVVAQADSLWHEGKMYGVDGGDSATLAQAYERLKPRAQFTIHNSYPQRGTIITQFTNSYAHACYHYGKLLRAKDDPVSAMQVFINAIHSGTKDYHILGRVYSNMGDICHLAGNFPLSYNMYERSADMYLQNGDTLLYYYLLNDMAFELAEQGKKKETETLIDSITLHCTNQGVKVKTLETKALLYQSLKCHDSVITTIDSLQSIGYNDVIELTMKARAFYNLNWPDSALYYANRVVQHSPTDACAIAAYYILSHSKDTINKDSVLILTSARADAQRAWAYSQSKLAQAVQLLEQDLARKPDYQWIYTIIGVILFACSCAILYYIWRKRKEHSRILHEIDIKQEQKTQLETNIVAMHSEISQLSEQQQKTHQHLLSNIEAACSTLRNSKDVLSELCWKDYTQMCAITNNLFNKLADSLQEKGLSEREVRLCILVLLNCYSDKQMADTLYYSHKTIRSTKRHIALKLGTTSANLRAFLMEKIIE